MTTTYLSTATPTGAVHLIRSDEPTPGFTLCNRRASVKLGVERNDRGDFVDRRVSWPRWSPADRGADPIQRASCTKCSDRLAKEKA